VSATRSPWTVRPYRPGDEAGAVALSREVFRRPLTPEQYRWKLLSRDVPFALVWVAVVGKRVVGHYACTPMRFKLGPREVLAAQACDAMTTPALRRQGILTAVGRAANAAWGAAGMAFVIGVPLASWGSPRQALGWRTMFTLGWLRRPLRLDRIVGRRLGIPWQLLAPLRAVEAAWNARWRAATPIRDEQVAVHEVEEAGPEFDELWRLAAEGYDAIAVRDREWVTQRYLVAPGYGYRALLARRAGRPAGYLIFRLLPDHGTGLVVDLFTAAGDAPTRQALIGHAVEALRRSGAYDVCVLVARGTRLEREFRGAGFLTARGTYDASIVSFAEGLPLDALRDPERWYTLGGDYDVV